MAKRIKSKGFLHVRSVSFYNSWICLLILWAVIGNTSCQQSSQKESFLIGFSQCTGADEWRKAMHIEMKRELSFHPELMFEMRDAKDNSARQIEQIRELVTLGIDLLIISPNEAEPITPVVEELLYKNIPVVIVDRKTNSPFYTAYIGANNKEIGKTAGEYVVNLLQDGGSILEIWGLEGSSPAKERHQGFIEGINRNKQLEFLPPLYGKWTRDSCIEELKKYNLGNRKIPDVIFAHNDVMAQAAYEFFQNKKQADSIYFLGVDGLGGPFGGMQAVEEGRFEATFLYPTGGEEAIRTAAKILLGEEFMKDENLETTVINKANVLVMKNQANKIRSQQLNIKKQEEVLENQRKVYRSQQLILYIILGSLIIAIFLGGLTLKALREKQQANRLLEKQNEEIVAQRNQISEMADLARIANQAKVKFFTNISHEFRTPLTLILGPVDELLRNASFSLQSRKDLELIRTNAMRLLRLINQLMDFRKIENNKMQLQAGQYDLIAFISDIFNAFEKTAHSRKIDYKFICKEENIDLWFDRNKLDKVLFNLLSNAFKFTNDKGKIHLKVEKLSTEVLIVVEDDGRGMSPEHVTHVFDRYYQGEGNRSLGTGLGLSLSKELIMLHRGTIQVSSAKWNGTQFEIRLPLGDSHLKENEKIFQDDLKDTVYEDAVLYVQFSNPNFSEAETSIQEEVEHAQTILLIEDNHQLRSFLAERLKPHFRLLLATDGAEGEKLAFEWVPDLIISDWVLPGKDGITLAKELKSDLRTSHIPIILLTAKSDHDARIEGMQSGADVYISKPFSPQFLEEQIYSLLRNREILKARYTTELSKESPSSGSSQGDRQFLNSLISKIEENLSDSNFSVQELGYELGLSRIQLYRKVKALLGYSVGDYIKMARLKKACQLLKETDLSMAEIAYQCGFSSSAYFSTAFKAQYQMSPSEFKGNR